MWCWRRIEGIRWTERKSNEEVLEFVMEKKTRTRKMIGHRILHDNIIRNIIEKNLFFPPCGKKGRG